MDASGEQHLLYLFAFIVSIMLFGWIPVRLIIKISIVVVWSAHYLLSNDEREKVKQLMPDLSVGNVTKKLGCYSDKVSQETNTKYAALYDKDIAHYVKNLSEERKQFLQEVAEKDMKRYNSEMANYKLAAKEKSGKEMVCTKDPIAPKSPHGLLSNDECAKVKQLMPDSFVGNVTKKLGCYSDEVSQETNTKHVALYDKDIKAHYVKTLSEERKQCLQELAVKDTKRYNSEMTNYKLAATEKSGKEVVGTKDTIAPKSAHGLVSNDQRAKVKQLMPDLFVGNVTKKLGCYSDKVSQETETKHAALYDKDTAHYVKTLSEERKQCLHELAVKDTKRYNSEMANYKLAAAEKSGKGVVGTKDPIAPKSAHGLLSNDEHSKVKQLMPDSSIDNFTKDLSCRSYEVSQETKTKYEAPDALGVAHYVKIFSEEIRKQMPQRMAEKDMKPYNSAIANYKLATREKIGKESVCTKDPIAPNKHTLSAHCLLSNDERAKVKQLMPDSSVGNVTKKLGCCSDKVFQETTTKYEALDDKDLAHCVKTLSEERKQCLQKVAEKDMKRYNSEMANYKLAGREESGKEMVGTKDPIAPKSAHSLLSNDEHAKVKQLMPDSSVGNVTKDLGCRSYEVSQEIKAKYWALDAMGVAHCVKILSEEIRKQMPQRMAEKEIKPYNSETANYKLATREKIGKESVCTKGPIAPNKDTMSAHCLLSNDERAKVKELMPDSSVGNVTKKLGCCSDKVSQETNTKYEALDDKDLAHCVKTLSEERKQCLQRMAEKDMKPYNSEMANYKLAARENSGKERVHSKDPIARKHTLSVSCLLSNDERVNVKQLMPYSTAGNVTKELGCHSDKISQGTNTKYQALATKEEAHYGKMGSLHGVPSTEFSGTTYKEDFCNVVLNVGNQHYPGHKLMMSLAGPVFADTMKQFLLKNEIISLNISNTDPAILYKVLQYVDTNDIDLHTVTEACHVLTLAENYQIFSLQEKCHEYINRHFIPPEDAIKKFETALTAKLKMDGVRELCMYTFSKATKAVFESASFIKAQLSTVEVIAKMNSLAIDCEMDILLAVLKWGKAYCLTKNLPIDTNLRVSIEPLLKHIRFLTIPLPVLKKVSETYSNLMTSEEICALTITILCPGFGVEIPKTLCSLNNPRSVPSSHKVESKQTRNTNCNPQPSNSTAVDALKGTVVKPLNISPLLQDPIKSKNNLTELTVVNSTLSEGKCTSVTATKLPSHLQDRSVTVTRKQQMKDVDSKILNGTRTVASPQKLTSVSGSTKKDNSASESDIKEIHVQDHTYTVIEFKLDNQREMPHGVRPADVKSVINFSLIEGFVELIGIKMQMRHVTDKLTRNIRIRLEVNDKLKLEQEKEKVIPSVFKVSFKKAVCLYTKDTAKIVVTVEDVQLKHCCMCVLPRFNDCDMMGNRYAIEITSNHQAQAVDAPVPILVSGILYHD